MLLRIAIAALLAAPAAPAPTAQVSGEFKLLQPPENGIVRDREVHVIADLPVTPNAVLTIGVTVDGKNVGYRLERGTKTYLHAVTAVTDLGAHSAQILIEGSDGSAKKSRQLLIWKKNSRFEISDPLSVRSANGFVAQPFHDGAGNKGCAGAKCHEFRLEKGVPVAAGFGCRGCHKREGEWRHAPMRTGDCYVCHNTEDGKFTPTKTAEETCFTCHDDMKRRLKTAKFTHGPVNKMVCELCHDPHGTRAEMNTWRGRNAACVTCHDGYDKQPHVVAGFAMGGNGHPVAKVTDPLEPSRSMACSACHSPHDAKDPMLYAYDQSDRTELCRMCHANKF